VNSKGTQMSGPAGAAIWSSPTIDLERKAIYVATGNAYSDPPVPYTDAILSLDMETGSLQWARQMTEGDGWNFNCLNPNRFSCPEHEAPDLDFGSSPILRTVAPGKRLLLVGQKSGMLHAIDPDAQGKIVWQVRLGKGGALGGIRMGVRSRRSSRLCSALGSRRREAGTRWRPVRHTHFDRRKNLVHGSVQAAVSGKVRLHRGSDGAGHRHSECCVFWFHGRPPPRLWHGRRKSALGFRYDAVL
jgi:hypothetical protein